LTDIHWKHVTESLCVICKISLDTPSYFICNECNKICQIIQSKISNSVQIVDIKSTCCNSDIESHQRITCGDDCHEKFIEKMLTEHGLFKKVIDQETNIAYKVPTRIIIEEGLKQEELKNFPEWSKYL